MKVKIGSLHLVCLTKEMSERTAGNYWYTVTSNGAALTAFATKEGLLRWMQDRRIRFTDEDPLPDQGVYETQFLRGEYLCEYVLTDEEFSALANRHDSRTVKVIDNAEGTDAILTTDASGLVLVSIMPKGVGGRKSYPLLETSHELGHTVAKKSEKEPVVKPTRKYYEIASSDAESLLDVQMMLKAIIERSERWENAATVKIYPQKRDRDGSLMWSFGLYDLGGRHIITIGALHRKPTDTDISFHS